MTTPPLEAQKAIEAQALYESLTARIFDRVRHYVISFNQLVFDPPLQALSSENARRLTDDEIRALIGDGGVTWRYQP